MSAVLVPICVTLKRLALKLTMDIDALVTTVMWGTERIVLVRHSKVRNIN